MTTGDPKSFRVTRVRLSAATRKVSRIGAAVVICLFVALAAWYVSPLRGGSSGQASAGLEGRTGEAGAASIPNSNGPILYLVPDTTSADKLPASRTSMEASGLTLVSTFDELRSRATAQQPLAVLVDRDAIGSLGKAEIEWASDRFQDGVAIGGIRISAAELANYLPVSKELGTSQMGPFKEGRVFLSLVYEKRSEEGDLCRGATSDYLDRGQAPRALRILTRAIRATAVCDPRNPLR